MTITVTGRAATDRGARYVKQLLSHVGKKLETQALPDGGGVIRYEDTVASLVVSADALEYAISGPEQAQVERAMGIVVGHLEKFGARDELECTWDDPEVAEGYRARREAWIAKRREEAAKEA